jgi:PTH1 family peptidyl-tRNA hydrolase
MKLVVGLGNPGKKYEETRHNLGWQSIDMLVGSYGDDVSTLQPPHGAEASVWQHKVTKDIFCKPTSMMNNSGVPVSIIVNFYKISIDDVIVFHDELDLDLGRWQTKEGGSSAGHNGLRSLIESLGSGEFIRYRLGIGTEQQKSRDIAAEDFVLQPFADSEKELVGKMLSEATTHFLAEEVEEETDEEEAAEESQ